MTESRGGSTGGPTGGRTSGRDRPDLCPGVLRPWAAEDGALVRLRLPGGQVTREQLAATVGVAEEHGDGRVHLTARGNLQLRGLPGHDCLPGEVVAAFRATGLLPHPTHDLVRNVMASPLTGLAGGRADLRPVVATLDERLCARSSLAQLPGRFLFVLDDGRGDLVDRRLDLGLVAVDQHTCQLRIGSRHWGPVVPLAEAADRLVGLARAFLGVRGHGPTAPWHVDELPRTPEGRPRDPRTDVHGGQPAYGRVADGVDHLEVSGGVLDRTALAGLPERLVVTPWKSLVAVAVPGMP